ncbi:hypothetical protein ASZ90_005275 [hydrocarbon metagenome]|uniref:Uncharacterized protein n=1 Tax=hydrocarbon metagenome TaxID=938273 RepID=A0A0W8FVH0_9ZZZZ
MLINFDSPTLSNTWTPKLKPSLSGYPKIIANPLVLSAMLHSVFDRLSKLDPDI